MKKIILSLFMISIFLGTTAFGNLLKTEKQKYQAKGIAVVIIDMKSKSSYMVDEESSEKGAAKKLTQDYFFEPGNTMIPISFSLILDKDIKCANAELIDCRNIDIDKDKCKKSYAQNAIIYSSSKIMNMLSPRLKGEELYNGLKKFGFSHVPSIKKLNQNIYKALCARGYGIRTNLVELTKAYFAFSNPIFSNPSGVIKEKTAKEMQKLLIEAVKKGTGKNAQIKGMIVGGKTGTALMVNPKTKRYSNYYNDIFIGFANGKGHRYTIGVLVIAPKVGIYASKTATKVFKDVVKSLLNDPFELAQQAYKKGKIKKTIQLLNKSCNSGNTLACYNLAVAYEAGRDVKQNFTLAKKYYQKSCKLGFELACKIYKGVYK